MKQISTGILAR